jgi:hypothetical protein
LVYERRIDSFKGLVDEAATMDADAGLRILATVDRRPSYIFVTRFGKRYTIMVYERKAGKAGGVGRRLAAEELPDIRQLKFRLSTLIPGRVSAFAY